MAGFFCALWVIIQSSLQCVIVRFMATMARIDSLLASLHNNRAAIVGMQAGKKPSGTNNIFSGSKKEKERLLIG